MSKYRKIDVRIWNDAKFRELSHNAKLVFFLLLTHPNMTAIGAMRSTLAGLAEEMDMELEAFREAFREAFLKGMVKHDAKACLIALPNFIKYNQPESPNVVKAWVNSLDLLPECQLKNEVVSISANALKGYSKAFQEALPKAFQEALLKGILNQEQEQEQEQEQKANKNKTREDFSKSEQSTIDELTKDDTRKNFTLPLDWKPNVSQFSAYCLNNGISPSQLTDSILKSFNEKANAKGEVKTEAQWCLYLARYLKTCLSNPQSVKQPTYQPLEQAQASPPPVTTFQKDNTPRKTKEERMAMFEQMTNLAGVN